MMVALVVPLVSLMIKSPTPVCEIVIDSDTSPTTNEFCTLIELLTPTGLLSGICTGTPLAPEKNCTFPAGGVHDVNSPWNVPP
jgi:hypothetical protein